jgi:hypothetical protein
MMTERGIILPDPNPQKEIQKHSENADWEYREYSQFLYNVGSEMMARFFNGLVYPDGKKVPNPLFAFDNLRNNNVLGQYDLFPDEYGLKFKITINTAHFEDVDGKKKYKYGDWALCEVGLHELIHVWQQEGGGKDPYKGGRNSHNKEFVDKAESLGLHPVPVIGCHSKVADADSPFGYLMKQFGIKRPDDVPRAEGIKIKDDWFEIGKKRKGRSSLTKYSCGCQNAWIGASEFAAKCNLCGNDFVKAVVLREVVAAMADTTPEEEPVGYDVDDAIDREQEQQDNFPTDDNEDLSTYMDQYSNG